MSVPFNKMIFSKGNIKLFINFSGVNSDNCINRDELSFSIYAVDSHTQKYIFSETLNFEQTLNLYNHLNSFSILRDNSKTTTGEFVEVTPDTNEIIKFIKNVDSTLIKTILDKACEDEKLKLIIEALSESEIENLQASIKQSNHQKALKNLNLLLELEATSNIVKSIKDHECLFEYIASQPEKIFQNWIEKNIWTLGIEYIKNHPARKIGIKSESDLIMETTDGFIDLIELKRPKFELFAFDENHESYYPSKELSKVIGQCMQYLKILDNYKLNLEKEYKFKLLRPRIKIIVGRSHKFNDEQYEALRMLNSNLNHIQIISYDYLLQCGANIISYYTQPFKTNKKTAKS